MINATQRLAGKKTIITAAASGMGKAGCELFAQEGARIAAVDRGERALDELVRTIEKAGGRARGFVVDLTDADATVATMAAAREWLGGIDLLWAHAGMPAPADIDNLDLSRYRLFAELNLTSAVLVSGEAIRVMRQQRSGSIVFTSSTVGVLLTRVASQFLGDFLPTTVINP